MENSNDIAIVGMACRFPGAKDISEFWNNLVNGVESVSFFTDEELIQSGIPHTLINNPHYIKASPVISDPDMFDSGFFGYTPMEAKMMDPQHRILLECAYHAFENAGCVTENYNGRIGVFTGSAMNTYFFNKALRSRFVDEYIPTLISNDKDFLSTRISYKLNLKGPSINVQTACSTSLVAVHLACQSLITEESDIVLAGAVSVKAPHKAGYLTDGGGIVSQDAHVKAFDEKANGTVFGSGCGVVVLKRLSDAILAGDNIYAVIKGTAVNNDGSEKAGYTAPSVSSQADAVIEAMSVSDVDAGSLSYIEAHGSGTPIGDPIEIAALTKAFRKYTDRKNFCAVGSVKSNVGHLDVAAGIASLIKTALSLKNKMIPPSINFKRPNPEIDFQNSPFYVNTNRQNWKSKNKRRAGVISTGMGGTNACLILEEAPETNIFVRSNGPDLFLFSAKSEEALDQSIKNFSDFLKSDPDVNLKDAAITLQTGRRRFNFRKFLVGAEKNEIVNILSQEKSKRVFSGNNNGSTKRPVIFLLPGIGDHYVGMGYDLYKEFKVFKEEVDNCAAILKNYLDTDIRDFLYPEDYKTKKPKSGGGIDLKSMLAVRSGKSNDSAAEKLNETRFVQPALFTIEYALVKLWLSLGIIPDAIAGHSMGEYVAACISGVFSLEDALKLISVRAHLVNSLPKGAMLAVTLPESELLPLLNKNIFISLINSPDLCVVAGEEKDIRQFEELLEEKKILFRHVQNGHAFHSRMMYPIQDKFLEELKKIKLNPPKIPFTSNVTGSWITEKEAVNAEYWVKHLTSAARYSDALEKVWKVKDTVFIEAGPGNTMSVLTMKHPSSKQAENPVTVASLRPQYDNQNDLNYFLTSIGKLWLSGLEITWNNLYPEKPRPVPLPGYPFKKESHWLEVIPDNETEKSDIVHKINDTSRWFYIPSWKRMMVYNSKDGELLEAVGKKKVWLIFADSSGVSSEITKRLHLEDQEVITVCSGNNFLAMDNDSFWIIPGDVNSYELLIKALISSNLMPDYVIHAWNITESLETSDLSMFIARQETGFYSLLYLIKALSKYNIQKQIKLLILSNETQEVTGTEKLSPEKSTSLGPCMVIRQEYPNIKTKSIDIDLDAFKDQSAKYVNLLLGEFIRQESDTFISYRSGQRWVQTYENVNLASQHSVFRKEGVYLITGGLGEVCYLMAEHLAEAYKAKMIILGRSELPEKQHWEKWLQLHDSTDPVSQKIKQIKKLEQTGGEVIYFSVNVADKNEISKVVSFIYQNYGRLNGVIHGAGIVGKKGFSAIQDIDRQKCEAHFQAKVNGLYALEKVLENKELDFCMLMSSLTPILGGLREVIYSSSNIFMDSFARRHNSSGKTPWISINWDLWRTGNSPIGNAIGKTLAELGIGNKEGISLLERLLALKDVPQIVVSTGDLHARIDQWVRLDSLRTLDLDGQLISRSNDEENSSEVINEEDLNKIMINIWKDLLGIKEVQKSDNFFELGGHSLLAIQLISAIRKKFQIDISLDDIFDSLTLSEMADKVDELMNMKEV